MGCSFEYLLGVMDVEREREREREREKEIHAVSTIR